MTRGSFVRRFVLIASLTACLPVPPGLPPAQSEIVYVDAGPAPSRAAALEERPKRADIERPAAPDAGAPAPLEQPADGKDPLHGIFTIADATVLLPGPGSLIATIQTSQGDIQCKLFEDKAPNTVANFVGLANGLRPFKSHLNGRWMKQPYYDGTTFHRVIKGFMIQGGDPVGNGTGEPGYVIPDEIWPGARHDHAGQLCMANRGKNTNGAQFFITDAASPSLDGNYTIFGTCSPTTTVRSIATVPKGDADRPITPVTIDHIIVTREPGN